MMTGNFLVNNLCKLINWNNTGHVQTYTGSLVRNYVLEHKRELLKYDKREEFVFKSDGGMTYLDFKGKSFAEIEDGTSTTKKGCYRPIIMIAGGLTSNSFSGYCMSTVEQFDKGKY